MDLSNSVTIVGAGMAGLTAAVMLSRLHHVKVVEKAPGLPNNHSALLRFRTPGVGIATGIPFRRVSVIKATARWRNPIADALSYSYKNTGTMRSDRSISDVTEYVERWIAPPNFINLLAARAPEITFNTDMDFVHREGGTDQPVISTVPMPILMEKLNYPYRPEFGYVEGANYIAEVADCDAYVTLHAPAPGYPFSRISITGNRLIIERPLIHGVTMDQAKEEAGAIFEIGAGLLGLPKKSVGGREVRRQAYAKILPIEDDRLRTDFMFWATDRHNIYSLGRFATWRPGLLLDDLIQDINKISGWIGQRSRYHVARSR